MVMDWIALRSGGFTLFWRCAGQVYANFAAWSCAWPCKEWSVVGLSEMVLALEDASRLGTLNPQPRNPPNFTTQVLLKNATKHVSLSTDTAAS
jgi:hypothetical protein